MIKINEVITNKQISQIKKLFKEYANSLGFDLDFQNFEKELEELPGEYKPPNGCLLLAKFNGRIAGCVSLRKLSQNYCEMKRLYVKPEFRGKEMGRKLAITVIEKARKLGYLFMRMDTIDWMSEAITLYRSLGFKKIPPYTYNPIENALYFELKLKK